MQTVLVVDDDPVLRLTLRRLLESAGVGVAEAQNGEEAMRLFRANRPDLVICDLVMPFADGLQTIMRMRRLEPAVKIVAISGGGRSKAMELLAVARQMGADHALAKPIERSQIALIVDFCGRDCGSLPSGRL
ncbi:regulator [Azospirillum sp. TSH100]|uniref:response regulator n=1 Tax=Azospirillum sp. TSH100 TaxID=652764 RepID=UPI000D618BA5|nr:response regulator [Azospirillum sp. TSH100]PWC84431.1 regulator [Azospirillum sp. TSH100]QCG87661.1 response regulator [Azospirillum sp. TSH100]